MKRVFTIANKQAEKVTVFDLQEIDGEIVLTANGVRLLYVAKDGDLVLFGTTKEGREMSGLEFGDTGLLNVYGHRRA